jgi:hypothetical protein
MEPNADKKDIPTNGHSSESESRIEKDDENTLIKWDDTDLGSGPRGSSDPVPNSFNGASGLGGI